MHAAAVYDNVGDKQDPILYAWRYVKNSEGSEDYAAVDAASQVVKFELRNDSLVNVGAKDAFIGLGSADGYFYGYGDTVSIYNKVKDAAPIPADASKAVKYKVSYSTATNCSSQSGSIWASTATTLHTAPVTCISIRSVGASSQMLKARSTDSTRLRTLRSTTKTFNIAVHDP